MAKPNKHLEHMKQTGLKPVLKYDSRGTSFKRVACFLIILAIIFLGFGCWFIQSTFK